MKITSVGLARRYPIDFEETVSALLRRVPPEHVRGLAAVVISGGRPLDERDPDGVMGHYYEAWEGEPASILLYPEEMAQEVPRVARGIPHVWRVLVAQTLFHEIGHHYQRFTHGIRRSAQEDHAEAYGHRHARAAFPRTYVLFDRWRALRERWRRFRRWRLSRLGAHASAEDLYELGLLYWESRDWERVVAAWEAALRRDPGHADARRWLPKARRRLRASAAGPAPRRTARRKAGASRRR